MNGKHDLTLNEQIGIEGQSILGDVDCSFNGILEGKEGVIDLAIFSGTQDIGKGVEGAQVGRGEIGLAQQGLLGERADGAEEGDRAAGPVDAGFWC